MLHTAHTRTTARKAQLLLDAIIVGGAAVHSKGGNKAVAEMRSALEAML